MEKSLRNILLVVLLLSAVSILMQFFERSALKDVEKKLELSKKNLDSAIIKLSAAQSKVDSVHSNMEQLRSFITQTEVTVSLLNAKKEVEDAERTKRAKKILDSLHNRVDSINSILKELDTVPKIGIKTLHHGKQ
jgi:cell division protein FtsL